jgi:DNA-binding IclR family transcriptional regulator
MTDLDSPRYTIAAVEWTAELVAALVRVGPASLSQLAAEAGCTPARAFRILHTLQAHRLALQDGDRGNWQLGTAWYAVARAARRHRAMHTTTAGILAGLAENCGEPVYLAARDGQECEIVSVHQPPDPVRLYCAKGERTPLHAGPGRLLLAYAPPPLRHDVLTGRLARFGSGTRTDPAWINADLPRIRARNWLITKDEVAEGIVTVSVAVRDWTCGVAAVVSIASPSIRMRPPRPHTLLSSLIVTAEALSQALGAPKPKREV